MAPLSFARPAEAMRPWWRSTRTMANSSGSAPCRRRPGSILLRDYGRRGGVKQYVQFLQKGIVAVEAKTGKFLWRYDKQRKAVQRTSRRQWPKTVTFMRLAPQWGLIKVKRLKAHSSPRRSMPRLSCQSQSVERSKSANTFTDLGQNADVCRVQHGKLKVGRAQHCPASICYAEDRLYLHGENGDVALADALRTLTTKEAVSHRRTNPAEAIQSWAYPVVPTVDCIFGHG